MERGLPVADAEELELHHLYRAMAWLGEELDDQRAATPLVPRCTKDVIEERLFARRSDLFSELDIVFFDTTSLYFEGEGGETLGQYGHSKDHRPDLHQMVVGVVLDSDGRPISCELWPGNTADVTTLVPVVDRLGRRFRIRRLHRRRPRYDLRRHRGQPGGARAAVHSGARMRQQKEVREQVLADRGRFRVVQGPRERSRSGTVEGQGGADRRTPLCGLHQRKSSTIVRNGKRLWPPYASSCAGATSRSWATRVIDVI